MLWDLTLAYNKSIFDYKRFSVYADFCYAVSQLNKHKK